MTRKFRLVSIGAAALASIAVTCALAQAPNNPPQQQQKNPPPPRVQQQRTVAPQVQRNPQQNPQLNQQRQNFQVNTGPRFQPNTGNPQIAPRVVTPNQNQNTANPNFVPRHPGQKFIGPNGATAARSIAIRNATRATIAGQNFSIRRGSYRDYRQGRWRTYAAVTTLGAIMFGTALYYPYAYIDAPEDYCEGLTQDGCQLQWQEVPTLEGFTDYQCVAYCPWQQ